MDSYLTEKTHHLKNEFKKLQKLDIHYAKTMTIMILCCIIHGWIDISMLLGERSEPPHWAVQSRFRDIYNICVYICMYVGMSVCLRYLWEPHTKKIIRQNT